MVRTSCGESVLHASSHLLEKETGETAQRALFSFFLSVCMFVYVCVFVCVWCPSCDFKKGGRDKGKGEREGERGNNTQRNERFDTWTLFFYSSVAWLLVLVKM